jgi:hypothetical protein
VWAVESTSSAYELTGPLLRIDPRTNRVVARVELRTPDGQPFRAWGVRPGRDVVWITGPDGALRLDPRTNRITKAIALAPGFEISDAALTATDLWLLRADQRLLRFDAETGARKQALPAPVPSSKAELRSVGEALVVLADNEGTDDIARVDPTSGRELWRKRLYKVGPSAAADGLLWIPTSESNRPGISVVGIDPRTGAIRARVRVAGEFNSEAIDRVGAQLWLTTAGGHAIVIGH